MRFSLRKALLGALLLALAGTGPFAQTKPGTAQPKKSPAPKAAAQTRTASPAAGGENQVVATVNAEPITRIQVLGPAFDDQLTRLNAQDPQMRQAGAVAASVGAFVLKRLGMGGAGPVTVTRAQLIEAVFAEKPAFLAQAVDNKIREVVIRQAAKRAGITVSQAEVDAQFNKSVEQARNQMQQQNRSNDEFLKAFGYNKASVRNAVYVSLLLDALLKKDFEKKHGRPIGSQDFVDGRHILVRVAPPPAVPGTDGASGPNAEDTEKLWAEAKQKIEGLLADIRSGKRKFEDVAKEVNEDGTKFREGSLGIFARGRMVPEFDKVAFSLEAGKVSEPVRTPFGWHLIRIDRLGKDLTPAERADAEKQYFQAQAQTFVQELVAQAKITNTVPLPPPGPGMGLE